MKTTKRLLGFLITLGMFYLDVRAEGTHECLTTTQPGQLAGLLAASASDCVDSLTISGPLGGSDLAELVSEEGKLAGLTYVDLTDVELVEDGEPYRVVAPEAIGIYTRYYYYSKNLRSESHALQQWTRIYTDDLSYLFDHMTRLTEVRLPIGLPAVGDGMFQQCESLRTVIWPEEVRRIGASAFYGCDSLRLALRTLRLDTIGNNAFNGCAVLADTLWLEGTSVVGDGAFSYCSELACLVSDEALKRIGGGAFMNCTALDSLLLPAGLMQVGEDAFWEVPWYDRQPTEDGVRYVGSVAYSLQSDALSDGTVKLREGTLGLADGLFAYSALTHIDLPASLRHIGGYTFESCHELTSVNLPEGLETIGEWCFFNCTRLSDIGLPASLKEIGSFAFNGCTGLLRVTYDAVQVRGENLFSGCDGLVEVNLGESVRTLPDGIFRRCVSLGTVDGGEGLEQIGANAFYECAGLSEFAFPATLHQVGSSAFGRTNLTKVILPESLDSIGCQVFDECKLESLSVRGRLSRMDVGAFSGCEVQRLEWNVPETDVFFDWGIDCKEAVIGSNVRMLPGNFLGNSAVASVVFEAPSSLIVLPNKAFYECRSLVSVTLPASVKYIGDEAFRYCSSLQAVSQDGAAVNVRLADEAAVAGVGDCAFYYCSSLRMIDLPDAATYVGEQAFYHCIALQEVGLSAALEEIRASAFQDCVGLQEIRIPEGTTSIGEKAFYQCTGLKRLSFPTTLTSIGTEAFSECTGLEEIDCPIEQPIPINITEFWNVPSTCVLRIPEGSRMDYLNSTRWREFDIEEVATAISSVELSENFRSVVRIETGGIMMLAPAEGQCVEIYTMDGRCVYSGMGTGRIELARGIYWVRVGTQAGCVLVK